MVEHLGPRAIAASATGGFNVFLIMILPMGTVFIVQSFVAQRVGANHRDATPRFAYYGLIIALASGLVALAAIPAIDPLLALADFSPEVRSQMSEYMAIRMYSVAEVVGVEVLANWYGGLGNTWMALVASIISMVSDLFLNWVLIYGHLGAPAMGVNGAALSTTIGSFVGLAVLGISFWRRWGMSIGGAPAPARQPILRTLSFKELRRVLRFGFPNGLRSTRSPSCPPSASPPPARSSPAKRSAAATKTPSGPRSK
jgi:MATE family multidrug resistance protein